jgi:hypothetical protein
MLSARQTPAQGRGDGGVGGGCGTLSCCNVPAILRARKRGVKRIDPAISAFASPDTLTARLPSSARMPGRIAAREFGPEPRRGAGDQNTAFRHLTPPIGHADAIDTRT